MIEMHLSPILLAHTVMLGALLGNVRGVTAVEGAVRVVVLVIPHLGRFHMYPSPLFLQYFGHRFLFLVTLWPPQSPAVMAQQASGSSG